jgi:hypothetical protein
VATVHFYCIKCGAALNVDERFVGKLVRCAVCRDEFILPPKPLTKSPSPKAVITPTTSNKDKEKPNALAGCAMLTILLVAIAAGFKSCYSSGPSTPSDSASSAQDAAPEETPPQNRSGIGIALNALVNQIPLLANNPPQRFQLADGIPQYRWYFDAADSPTNAQDAALIYILNGPDSNLSLAEVIVTSASEFSTDHDKVALFGACVFVGYATGQPWTTVSDDFLAGMKKPFTEWHVEYPPNIFSWMVDKSTGNYRFDFSVKHQ